MRVASAYFDAQDFEGALRAYQQLYVETQDPPLLLNVGTCFERLGRNREAISSLQRYIELDPSSPARRSAEATIERIQRATQTQQTQQTQQTVATSSTQQTSTAQQTVQRSAGPETTVPRSRPVAPWVVVGLGGAAIVTAPVLFFAVREPALARIPAGCDQSTGVCDRSVDLAQVNRDADAARTATTIAAVSLGVGVAAVGAGIAWAALASRESPSVTVALIPTRDGALVSAGGRF